MSNTPSDTTRDPSANGSTAVGAAPGDHLLTAGGTTAGAGRTGSGSGTTDTAKQEASGVASEAADQGKRVASTAADQASQVASEAGRQAKDLYHQTRGQLTDQVSTGQRQAAFGLSALAEELKGLAEGRAGSGVATDLVHQASQRVEAVGTWLERREPADVLREVEGFARRRPVAFLAIAAGVGLLAGRLTRGLAAASQQSAPQTSSRSPEHPYDVTQARRVVGNNRQGATPTAATANPDQAPVTGTTNPAHGTTSLRAPGDPAIDGPLR